MNRKIAFLYGLVSYLIFFACFLYAIGFVGNIVVPKTLDSEPAGALAPALTINVLLLGLFAVQHSVMARPAFKRWWTKVIPTAVERSTDVLASSLALALLFWQWRPIGGVIWDVQHPAGRAVLYGAYAFGWVLLLYATVVINHFDLFGLRQVWLHLRDKPYKPLLFVQPVIYRMVRHPLYVAWLTIFWATPTMSSAHLLFAVATTGYILIAIQFEERDLIAEHGARYSEYRDRVPMLIPIPKRIRPAGGTAEAGV